MNIVWSDIALASAQDAASYARDQFGERQVRILREKIKKAINKISIMPTACPLEQSLLGYDVEYRYVTLFPKLELVFHAENEDTIMIDRIWNTRRNPSVLKATIPQQG